MRTDDQGVVHITQAEANDPGFQLPDGVAFFVIDSDDGKGGQPVVADLDQAVKDIAQLQTQQALQVEVLREVLMGNFDNARIQLDAISPARAGQWHNVQFPKA